MLHCVLHEGLGEDKFNDTLLATEFHHVSARDTKLGEIICGDKFKGPHNCYDRTYRGDSVPVLLPEDYKKFKKVTIITTSSQMVIPFKP